MGVSGDSARSWLRGGVVVDAVLGGQFLRRVAARVWLAAWLRRADHRRPRRFGWLVAGGRGACRALDVGCFLAPPAPDFDGEHDELAAAGGQKFWVCSFFASSCCVQGCPPVGACVCAGLFVPSERGH